MHFTSPLRSLAMAMEIPLVPRLSTKSRSFNAPIQFLRPHLNAFSTSARLQARRKNKGPKRDPRITMIRYFLLHPKLPPPLRLSRFRSLRHWTIHRAAQLLARKERISREQELERQYNSMRAAMEELRLGIGDGGRLYRQAMDRRGLYGGLEVGKQKGIVANGGVPMEYARAQTEGPPKMGWDEDWTRAWT